MAYARVDDMVRWFGAAEMIRLSTPDGVAASTVVPGPIEDALERASSMIDTYLRKRYQVPLEVAPSEIGRAACLLARYDLSTGGERMPGEQTKLDRQDTIAWLRDIAAGRVVLDLAEVAPGMESYATMHTRRPMLGSADDNGMPDCGPGGWPTAAGFWGGDGL
jgi:phage gp36-like protein